MTTGLRLGTRRSPLALAQAQEVASALEQLTGHAPVLVPITTEGDLHGGSLTEIGGTGVFAGALRAALLEHRIDLAVHSLKDLPTAPYPGLRLAAICQRGDPRDVVCARDGLGLASLPPGARVGTGSPRRVGQLRALGLGLDVVEVRGNVGTRLGLVDDGHLDAVVLAYAGLQRLGALDAVSEVIDPIQMLPAPGQAALAVECRAAESDLVAVLAALDHADTRAAVTAERAVLTTLEAGCTAPVGALAVVDEGEHANSPEIYLRAVVTSLDGAQVVRLSATGPAEDPVGLGSVLAQQMLQAGAPHLSTTPSSSPSASWPANTSGGRARLPKEESVS